MDFEMFSKIAPWVGNLVIGAAALYAGKVSSDLRVEILKDAEERERRLSKEIKELGDKFETKLAAGGR